MLERRTFDSGPTALVSTGMEGRGFLVAFTERTGGASEGPFASLNLGFTRDDPGRVRENRARACRALGLDRFARGWQVHGAGVSVVGPELAGAGFDHPRTAIPDTDAMVTDHAGVALSVLTADCVPVALADPDGGTLAVVHAGWRGVVAGVLPAVLRHFPDSAAVVAVVGPAVGPEHYPVGEDVAGAVERSSRGDAVVSRRGGRVFLDLSATVAAMLERNAVRVVERAEVCTACEPDRFFSYRRDGETGRQALIGFMR